MIAVQNIGLNNLKFDTMMTALIIVAGLVCALIPISRIIQLNIQRSSKYSDDFKHKAKIINNVVNLTCVVAGVVILLILDKMK